MADPISALRDSWGKKGINPKCQHCGGNKLSIDPMCALPVRKPDGSIGYDPLIPVIPIWCEHCQGLMFFRVKVQ